MSLCTGPPLFNKLEPLEPGSLRDGIESLAKTVGFPLRKLFVMDGSKRSSHSNAFLFGFGSNQSIVLFDTLIKQVKEKEILGILCHEIGHWHHWHIQQSLAVVLACACRGGAGAARAPPRPRAASKSRELTPGPYRSGRDFLRLLATRNEPGALCVVRVRGHAHDRRSHPVFPDGLGSC